MKKIVMLLVLGIFWGNFAFSQNVSKIEDWEKSSCDNYSARSVAYHFVNSLIKQDYTKLESLMGNDFRNRIKSSGLTYYQYFETSYNFLKEVRPIQNMGYQLAVYDESTLDFDDGSTAFAIAFVFVDSMGNVYYNSTGSYEKFISVRVFNENGKMKVSKFKCKF